MEQPPAHVAELTQGEMEIHVRPREAKDPWFIACLLAEPKQPDEKDEYHEEPREREHLPH